MMLTAAAAPFLLLFVALMALAWLGALVSLLLMARGRRQ